MNTQPLCPTCGQPVPVQATQGLCPQCLMRAAFATAPAHPMHGGDPAARASGFKAPGIEQLAAHFPQLELLDYVGQGGMGAVYKARQPALDRLVALKILVPPSPNDPGFAERFTREARALARLNHPHIVGVHDFGEAGGFHYLLMEYVAGANLRELMTTSRISPRQALTIVTQVCEALQFAHDNGVVHRDIKPENILLDSAGSAKIADFGLAKLVGAEPAASGITAAGDVMGTPHYMAPEQVESPQAVDHRADIYSLGVVFYQMLTGELPLGRFGPPSHKVQIDVRLDEIVLRALEKEPALRYQQVSVLRTDVENVTQTTPMEMERTRNAITAQLRPSEFGLSIAAVLALATAAAVQIFMVPAIAREGNDPAARAVAIGMICWSVLMAIVMLHGAWHMAKLRNRRAALAGCVAGIIAGPASIVGLPIGIRALAVLNRREVRAAMR